MKEKNDLADRKFVIGGVAVLIVVVYIIRLFTLQITSDDYKKSADSNAFLRVVISAIATANCWYLISLPTILWW